MGGGVLMVSTIFIALTGYFTLNAIVAYFFQNVAALKGYGDEVHAFGVVFFFGIVGCIYVAALADRIQQEQRHKIVSFLFERDSSGLD